MSRQVEEYLRRMSQGGTRSSHRVRLAIRYVLMLAVAAISIGPFLWLFYLSIRTRGGIYTMPRSRQDFSFEVYPIVWTQFQIGQAMLNSLLASVGAVILTVSISSLAAYPLARFDFYGRNVIFLAMLATLMMPFQLYMIPLYLMTVSGLRWSDVHLTAAQNPALSTGLQLLAVILPGAASVLGIYLIKNYYATIPRDMEEAARVDGAGEFRLWWRIMLPLTKPAVATLAIFTFVGAWSSFLWPLLVLREDTKTLPVALATLTGTFIDRISFLAAGSVLAIAPVIVFFLLLQRFFLGGMTIGAVKG